MNIGTQTPFRLGEVEAHARTSGHGALRTGGYVAAPTAADLFSNALRAANVPPDSSITDIIIPEVPLEESM